MSINNFLKIRIFNVEQNIKSKASQQIKDINKTITEIQSIRAHLNDIEKFDNRSTVLDNLQFYQDELSKIRFFEGNLFNYIERYYCLDTTNSTKPITTTKEAKPKSKSKTTRKKKAI